MKASGPGVERETIINFNDSEDVATIWTASDTVYRRLIKRLGTEYLTEDRDDWRHAVFTLPKGLIYLPRRPKPTKPMSEARREELRARGQVLSRAKKQKQAIPEDSQEG